MVLSQRKYTLDILTDSGLEGCRPSSFPMEQNIRLTTEDDSPLVDAGKYRRLVGRLLYVQVTRPDIAFAVNTLSQFVSAPRETHWIAALRVLRYLKATPGQGIFLPADSDLTLVAYCDFDWLGCPFTRRSKTGYFITLGGAPISWKTKKQSVVSRSSAEAEYRSMATTVSEILWLRWLLTDIEASQTAATRLYCDNQATGHIANNPVFHERTKHVEMDCYFLRERVESGEIFPAAIHTKDQLADLFTKPLGTDRFRSLLGKMGVRDLHISVSFPFIYLGLPVGANMLLSKNWIPLADKLKGKLSEWKAKTLSFGGRLTLVKSMLGSISFFYFSVYKALIKLIESLEGIRRKFLLGGNSTTSKICWVEWKKVLAPKSLGGLGVASLRASNLALLAKWWWRYKHDHSNL
uniref:Reverse transcriptase Ty1/copia-type domain-containing protein n=1 Tax=Lactuca sativa TaxID=4236 RepID=A0A9R1UWN8_LACSA|nr:hypothetical protein LSAT_V11C700353940 [Lactuca sativa]